jgi:hypothetical protein
VLVESFGVKKGLVLLNDFLFCFEGVELFWGVLGVDARQISDPTDMSRSKFAQTFSGIAYKGYYTRPI